MNNFILINFLLLVSLCGYANQDCRAEVEGKVNVPKTLATMPFEQAAKEVEFQAFLQVYDKKAFEVAKLLTLKKEETATQVQKWFDTIKVDNLSVLEFTTLQLVMRVEYLKNAMSPELKADILKNLEKNWFKYTGQKLNGDKILNRSLPKEVLSTQDLRIQRFNQLATKINGQTLEIEPGVLGKIVNKMAPIGLLAFGLSATGGDILTGALVGYSVSLATEYWIHRWVMHSGKSKDKLPWFININDSASVSMLDLARLHFSHHQELNAKNYLKQEGSDDLNSSYVQNQLIPKLVENGMTPARIEAYVVDTKHATIMEKRGWKTAHVSIVPASIAVSAMVAGDPIVASMTAALMAYSFIAHVNYVHPMMHRSRTENRQIGNRFDRWFVETDYFRYIARFHFGHHTKPNTNLSVLPLGYDSLVHTESYLPLTRLIKMMEDDLVY